MSRDVEGYEPSDPKAPGYLDQLLERVDER